LPFFTGQHSAPTRGGAFSPHFLLKKEQVIWDTEISSKNRRINNKKTLKYLDFTGV
jgi:hypothetical protein